MKKLEKNLDVIKFLITKKDFDWLMVVEGYEGVGKSTLAWHVCKYIDPDFNAQNIVFEPDQFRLLLQNARKGESILIDEGGLLLFSRNAMQTDNKELIQALTTIRAKNLFICICVPSFHILDKYVREHRVKSLIRVAARGRYQFFSKKKIKEIRKKNGTRDYIYPDPNFTGSYEKVTGQDWKDYLDKKGDVLDRTMKWFKASQVAKKLKVNVQTVYKWVREDKIEYERLKTGSIRISDKAIKAMKKTK